MSKCCVPSKEDWGELPHDDLDLRAAYKDFFGKTNEEVKQIFSNCVIEGADSLRWMPTIPFRYYMMGFVKFVSERDFKNFDAPDAASSFLNLVEEKLKRNPDIIMPIMDNLIPVVTFIAANQGIYEADVDIYGDFQEKEKSIIKLWEAQAVPARRNPPSK